MTFKEEIYNNFVRDFSSVLREKTNNLEISKLIFLCIGTDRVTGDSFGPLVGYKLKYLFKNEKNVEIIGSLDDIICRHNIVNIINNIENMYDEPFLIAIDAAISNKTDIGRIVVSKDKAAFQNVIKDIIDGKYDALKKTARTSFLNNFSRKSLGMNIGKAI